MMAQNISSTRLVPADSPNPKLGLIERGRLSHDRSLNGVSFYIDIALFFDESIFFGLLLKNILI